MKKITALLLVFVLFLTGCSFHAEGPSDDPLSEGSVIIESTALPSEDPDSPEPPEDSLSEPETGDPGTDEPETDDPGTDDPETDAPETDEPETDDPETDEPETDEPETAEPETNHTYTASVTAPTCEKAGYTTYTCSDCGDTYVADEVAATGHNHESTVTAPTCTTNGYTTYTCTVCFYSYTANEAAATGHDWKAATTEAPKTCITCGITEGDKLPGASTGYSETLFVNYINVGQGDSILIKVGDCDILIDAGTASYGSTVSTYLKGKGVDDVELMINTHPDADHCGGLTKVLQDFVVEEVWASPLTKTTAAYKNFASAVKSEGLSMKNPSVGTVYTYEYLTLTVLYSGAGTTNSNDSSLVVMLQYGSMKFLFTGDISDTIENKLVKSGVDLRCDVLKVAHHGSKYSSSAAFLKATAASYGVICVGANNDYGHPTSAALNRLSSAGISVYRTDKNGHVVFSTNGTALNLP